MSLTQTTSDALASKTANVATYGGSAGAIFGGINANWVAAIGGIVIGLAGLLVTIYYRRRQDKRLEAEHKLRMVLRGDIHDLRDMGADE